MCSKVLIVVPNTYAQKRRGNLVTKLSEYGNYGDYAPRKNNSISWFKKCQKAMFIFNWLNPLVDTVDSYMSGTKEVRIDRMLGWMDESIKHQTFVSIVSLFQISNKPWLCIIVTLKTKVTKPKPSCHFNPNHDVPLNLTESYLCLNWISSIGIRSFQKGLVCVVFRGCEQKIWHLVWRSCSDKSPLLSPGSHSYCSTPLYVHIKSGRNRCVRLKN